MIERIARLCHMQWTNWMIYLFSQSEMNDDGSITIPAELANRWKMQTITPYSELNFEEKESDRKEAIKFISVFKGDEE